MAPKQQDPLDGESSDTHRNDNHHQMGQPSSGGAVRSWQDDIKTGKFKRSPSAFRKTIRSLAEDPEAEYPPEKGRYHLYLAKACPWANRMDTLVHMAGLQDCIGITFCDPIWGSIGNGRTGWRFSEEWPDTITHKNTLYEVYLHYHPDYTGKATTPMLLDKRTGTIVSNESRDMLESICWGFSELQATPGIGQQLFPRDRKAEIDAWIDRVYEPLLNGVYKCGFASSQEDYNTAITAMFSCLDHLDDHLAEHQWMLPGTTEPTVLDLVVGVTLCRFDAIYYLHFLCCKKHVYEYPHLSHYARSFYQIPAVRNNTDLESCKQHYFRSHPAIAPSGLVAAANPAADLGLPHNRGPLFRPRNTPSAR